MHAKRARAWFPASARHRGRPARLHAGAGSSGLVNGPERDEVYIKFKTGAAPEVAHFYVLLYSDRLLARPIEVWQVRGCSALCGRGQGRGQVWRVLLRGAGTEPEAAQPRSCALADRTGHDKDSKPLHGD